MLDNPLQARNFLHGGWRDRVRIDEILQSPKTQRGSFKEGSNSALMFQLQPVSNNQTALDESPMIRATGELLGYLVELQTIGLTQTKAFNRRFVRWAAEAFAWPGFDLERYFAVSTVMNEYDFPPLEELHFILLQLKLIRHHKLTCRLTKSGRQAR